MTADDGTGQVRFKGPGHWRSQAELVQPGLSPAQIAELERSDDEEPGRTISSQLS
jgi:hypothetical protein